MAHSDDVEQEQSNTIMCENPTRDYQIDTKQTWFIGSFLLFELFTDALYLTSSFLTDTITNSSLKFWPFQTSMVKFKIMLLFVGKILLMIRPLPFPRRVLKTTNGLNHLALTFVFLTNTLDASPLTLLRIKLFQCFASGDKKIIGLHVLL